MKVSKVMKQNFDSVQKSDSVSAFIGKARKSYAPELLVFDGKKYAGLASNYKLKGTKKDMHSMKVAKITINVPILTGDESLQAAAGLMYGARTHILPVIKKDKVVGVVRDKELLDALASKGVLDRVSAEQVMSKKLVSLAENDRLGKAIEIFHKIKIRHLPVVLGKKVIGMVGLSNIINEFLVGTQKRETGRKTESLKAVSKERVKRDSYSVSNFMTTNVITAKPDAKLSTVAKKMARHNVSSIVIEKYDMAVGIVTTRDVLKVFG